MNAHEVNPWYLKIGWTKNPFILDIRPGLMVGHIYEFGSLVKNIDESLIYVLITVNGALFWERFEFLVNK